MMLQGPKGKKLILDLIFRDSPKGEAWKMFKSYFGATVAKGFERNQDRFSDGAHVRVNVTVFTDIELDPTAPSCECHGVDWDQCPANGTPV